MALNATDLISTLRKQSLNTLVKNININFLSIKNKIYLYCNSLDVNVDTIMDMFNINIKNVSSYTINAAILLLYLDFYTSYVSLYSIYTNYKGLIDVSKNKYLYISNLINELNFNINLKEKIKENKYVSYADFVNINAFSVYKQDIQSRTGLSLNTLSFNNALSLPISSSTEHNPSSVITLWDNSTESFAENSKFNKNTIYYNLYRLDSDYVGVVSSIKEANTLNISKSLKLSTTGVLTDIDLSYIYIKVTYVSSTFETIKVVCSSTTEEWSSEITVYTNTDYNILIENDIDTGITFNIAIDTSVKVNDTWVLNIKRIQLPYPSVNFNFQFNNFDNISMLKLKDISDYELVLNSASIKEKKDGVRTLTTYKKNNMLLGFPNTSIDEYKVKYTQRDSSLYNYNGKISYNYAYYLTDIAAIVNTYNTVGSISFNSIDIENINNIKILSTEYIYKRTDNQKPKMFIEYNIYAEVDLDKILIPALSVEEGSQSYIDEYLIQSSISNDTVTYTTRFPVDLSLYNPILIDISDDLTINVEIKEEGQDAYLYYIKDDNEQFITIKILNFDSNKQYAIRYVPKIYNASDTYDTSTGMSKWVKSNKIYYIYYKDKDGNTRIGIKTEDTNGNITTVSGTVSSYIEMRSIDESYLSPYIVEYYMICN